MHAIPPIPTSNTLIYILNPLLNTWIRPCYMISHKRGKEETVCIVERFCQMIETKTKYEIPKPANQWTSVWHTIIDNAGENVQLFYTMRNQWKICRAADCTHEAHNVAGKVAELDHAVRGHDRNIRDNIDLHERALIRSITVATRSSDNSIKSGRNNPCTFFSMLTPLCIRSSE